MKKKLVLEYWSSKGKMVPLPAQYSYSRYQWICEIVFEKPDGFVEEFEVKPKGKILLRDLLPSLNDQLDALVPSEAVDCGFRIYRCIK